MKTCEFTIALQQTAAEFSARAAQTITAAGASFEGDENEGGFSLSTPMGKIVGNYKIAGDALQVRILSKPFLIGCGRIEKELRSYLNN